MNEIIIPTAALGLSIAPWLTELKKLPLHFKPQNLEELKSINNVFATIFSGSIYFFVSNSLPIVIFSMPPWWVFILISVVCLLLVLLLLLKKSTVVNDGTRIWPIFLHSILYFAIFCSITFGLAKLKLLEEYIPLQISVKNADTQAPVPSATVRLENDSTTYMLCVTDSKGKANWILHRDCFCEIENWEIKVAAANYTSEKEMIINGDYLHEYLRYITIKSQ